MRLTSCLLLCTSLALPSIAAADIFKCTKPDGSTYLSNTACNQANSTTRQQTILKSQTPSATPAKEAARNAIVIAPSPEMIAAQKYAEEQAAKERARSEEQMAKSKAQSEAAARQKAANQLTDKQLIAECETNLGVRCNDPNVIKENRDLHTPMTEEQRLDAIRQRRLREQGMY